jgi:hypothetical protein
VVLVDPAAKDVYPWSERVSLQAEHRSHTVPGKLAPGG